MILFDTRWRPSIAGLYSGIVFTEIDHNFVNLISVKHLTAINDAFKDRQKWTKQGVLDHYGSAYEVFNEYMTHSVHLLYIKDHYPAAIYELVRADRVHSNAGKGGFYRFEAFLVELQRLYVSKRPNQTIADLYVPMLDWAKRVDVMHQTDLSLYKLPPSRLPQSPPCG